MKNLYQFLVEKQGFVSGENDWTRLVEYIIQHKNDRDKQNNFYVKKTTGVLCPWMAPPIKIRYRDLDGEYAYFDRGSAHLSSDKKKLEAISIYLDNKFIENSDNFKIAQTLQHEIQHAYDLYIDELYKNPFGSRSESCIGDAIKDPNIKLSDFIKKSPSQIKNDHIYNLWSFVTYALMPTEVNAFSREFNIYLQDLKNKGITEIDWNIFWDDLDQLDSNGALTLITLDALFIAYENANKYKIDWDEILYTLNDHRELEYRFNEKTIFANLKSLLKTIIAKWTKYPLKQFKRIVKNSGITIKNAPEWFK